MNIEEFAKAVEEGEKASLVRAGMNCEANMKNCVTHTHQGRKWCRVDIGGAGKYMIDPDGNIFGIKAYGVPHLGHHFGTLSNPSPACFRGLWG